MRLNYQYMLWIFLPVILQMIIFSGCGGSGGAGPTDPGLTPDNFPDLTGQTDQASEPGSQVLWGLYDIYADPASGEIEIVPLRNPMFQVNATRFLQPPDAPISLISFTVDTGASDIPNGLIVCDITIDHPFPGTKFWGFDTRGIVMGSPAGAVEIVNQDGYTRWWNPVEFTTVGKIFGYTEGILALPGPTPESSLHPYKYFADSLGSDDPMVIDPATRGVFNSDTPGAVTRRYELQFPTPGGTPNFHFKYAISASWEVPDGGPPWELSKFPLTANQAEAYRIAATDSGSSLYNDGAIAGGDLSMTVTVFDWQKPDSPGMTGELAALIVESQALGLPPTDILALPDTMVSPGPDINSESYQFTVTDLFPVEADWADVWITAESANITTYAPDIPGISGFDYPEDAVLSAYNCAKIEVSDEIQYSDPIYVDDSSTSPDEFGTMDDPFKTIGAALSVATAGDLILVDDSGVTYAESVVLTDGISLYSENWDILDGTDRASIQTPDVPGANTVRADGVSDAVISGFNVRPAGSYTTDYPIFVTMIYLSNCTNITVSNCYFNSEELPRHITGVYIEDSSDIEIGYCHFEHLHGPDPLIGILGEMDMCIYAEYTPNMYIHNIRMNDLGLNFNNIAHNIYAVWLYHCDNPIVHNSLIYHIQLVSDGQGAALAEAFKFEYCDSPVVYNNTVNFLDTVENFFINQAFCYFFRECPNGTFYNNIASNVTESGFAPDGSPLGRGVQSYLYDLPCDYTLTWNIESPYFQEAHPNIGCVETQPLFIDPEGGLHDIGINSDGQLGCPDFVDWDDAGLPSGDPDVTDPNTRSRMGCHGGPYGGSVGCVN